MCSMFVNVCCMSRGVFVYENNIGSGAGNVMEDSDFLWWAYVIKCPCMFICSVSSEWYSFVMIG